MVSIRRFNATAAVFVSSKVMDAILSGMTQSKQILVISKKWQDIAEEIMTSLNRGVTQIKAKGVYSGQERPCVAVCHRQKTDGTASAGGAKT